MPTANDEQQMPTKQKILVTAAHLFATKGYTETTMRDITVAVGINKSSLYYHFPSKEDILVAMLTDYGKASNLASFNKKLPEVIKENPNLDGIMECMQFDYTKLTDTYYADILHMGHRDQHRNDIHRQVVIRAIKSVEDKVERIFEELKKNNVIRQDADPDFWQKTTSSLAHNTICRMMLGIGEDAPNYVGMDLQGLVRFLFGLALELYKVPDDADGAPSSPAPSAP